MLGLNWEYNKTYYLVTGNGKNIDDELFTSKAEARKEAKKRKTKDIMMFRGCKGDEMAMYIGQLE